MQFFSFRKQEEMQRASVDEMHLRQTVDPTGNTQKVKSIDYSTDFDDITEKVDNMLQWLLKRGVIHADLVKYLSGFLLLAKQSMIFNVKTIKWSADSTYKDLQTLDFNIKLPANQYMNWNSVHICFPMKSKKFWRW